MTQLSDLGFVKGEISETIVSTYNAKGEPNAAPMGTTMVGENQLAVNIFNSTKTFQNLQTSRCCVVNVTSNIDIFYRTAFKEANQGGHLPLEWFQKAQAVNAPKLRMSDAAVEGSVCHIGPIDSDRSQTVLDAEHTVAKESLPKVYSRAFGATLEAIVHATRVKVFINNKNEQEKVPKLLTLISNSSDVVLRTAPNSRYAEIMADLNRRIASWRTEK